MTAILQESDERHDWTLGGHRITQLCVDLGACRIQSWSLRDSLEIRLAASFRLTLADGTVREINPEHSERLAPLLTMIGREILHLTVAKSGSLSLRLSDGSTIEIDSHPRHAAFEVNGGGSLEGVAYLARPGGGSPWNAV
jgi:hypothetical protein